MASEDNAKLPPHIDLSRREMLKGAAVGVAAAGFASAETTAAEAQGGAIMP
jgi:TAT (twin-arginine translocation) pathway-exported protein